MAFRSTAGALAGMLLAGTAYTQSLAPGIVGRWQYLQPPDRQGEILDISLIGDRYRGIMNGLERAGEHGLYYYGVEVTDLSVAADGSVRFTVGPRTYFRKRPKLPGVAGDAGGTKESMHFSGRLQGSELVLECRDAGASCPDSTLRFRKLSAKDGASREK
jgi:hypothetical protein